MTVLLALVGLIAIPALATLVRGAATGLDADLERRSLVTLALNVVGSAVLGYVVGEDMSLATLFVGVLGMGALTTFSTFVAQLVEWVEVRRPMIALGYLVATLALSILAADLAYRW